MYLLSLHVKDDYNLLSNFKIDFRNNISVIIGANGSGKSSILEVLAKIFSCAYLGQSAEFGFDLYYAVTFENESKRTSTSAIFYSNIVKLSATKKDEPITIEAAILPSNTRLKEVYIENVAFTPLENPILSVYFPSNIVIYYSGLSNQMEEICYAHEKHQKEQFLKGNLNAQRKMFYFRPVNFKMLLIALFSYEFGDIKEFVLEKLNITELSGFTIKIIRPDVNWAKGKKASDIWGAKGAVKDFCVLLSKYAKFTFIADDDNSIEYNFSMVGQLYNLKNSYGDEKKIFELLDMLSVEGMLGDIRISLNKGIAQTSSIPQDGELHFNSDALSEGEQQYIALRGINEILIKENTLLLFDEPDNYLHPNWQANFINELSEYTKFETPELQTKAQYPQFVITTHSPQLVSNFQNGELFILNKGELVEHSGNFYGRDVNSILAHYMSSSYRPASIEKLIEEISSAISKKEFELAKKKLETLKNEVSDNDSEYIRLSTKLNFLAK